MSIFARENKVLWVERRPHRRLRFASDRRSLHRRRSAAQLDRNPRLLVGRRMLHPAQSAWRSRPRHISDNLYVFSYPPWAPVSRRTPLKQFTRTVRRIAIRNAMRTLQMLDDAASGGGTSGAPVVWFSHPRMVDLVREIPRAGLMLYHVVDEYTAYTGVTAERRRLIEAREREMMAMVDAVIVVSKALYEAKRPYNPHTYLVPNGVNYAAYSEVFNDPQLPQKLERIAKPRVGYSGLIGDRLNLQMLRQMAEEHPQWSLVFLGEARVVQQAAHWQAMLQLPNVHYIGQVDVLRVPHYLKGFQVGLMPYRLGLESENISPLKLYDYLAAGLPVASVDIPAAREFSQHVHLARTPQEFAQTVTVALADTTPERVQQRRQIAALHTWEARVEQLSGLIEELLAVRGTRPKKVDG